ncbi:MAG: hypothetical protein ACRYGB_04900 [Janthinobacterium lividum]
MITSQILSIILGSSLISALLTNLVNVFIQRNNYKNEYFKKLIDRRIDAYENVENLVSKMKIMYLLENEQLCNLILALGKNHFDEFSISIAPTITKSFWLDDKISALLTKFSACIVNEIYNKIDQTQIVETELQRLGCKNRIAIQKIRYEIKELLYKDFDHLHEIKTFINTKRNRLEIPIFSKKYFHKFI